MSDTTTPRVISPKGNLIIDMMQWKGDTGYLTIMGMAPREEQEEGDGDTMWRCQCACGNICTLPGRYIRLGRGYKSCGECDLVPVRRRKKRFNHKSNADGGEMNEKRMKSKLEGLSAMEKKVFEATPISQEWKTGDIIAELSRKSIQVHPKTVSAILNTLANQKLVIEGPRGFWRRIRDDNPQQRSVGDFCPGKEDGHEGGCVSENHHNESAAQTTQEKAVVKTETTPVKRTPIDIIEELMGELNRFKDKAESAALEISQYIAGVESQAQKLEKFKELFKEMGA